MHTPFGSSCHFEWQVILLPIQKQLASCSSKLLIYLIVVIYLLCRLYWFSAMFVSVKGARHLGSLLMNFGMPSTWWIQLFILILESKWTSWVACPFRFLVGWPLQELCFSGTGKWNELLSSVLFSCFNTGSNGSQIMRSLALAPLFFNGHLSIFLRVSEPNNQAGFKWISCQLVSNYAVFTFLLYLQYMYLLWWMARLKLFWNSFKCAAQHVQFS